MTFASIGALYVLFGGHYVLAMGDPGEMFVCLFVYSLVLQLHHRMGGCRPVPANQRASIRLASRNPNLHQKQPPRTFQMHAFRNIHNVVKNAHK
jgi:hypothetical protein